MTGFLQEGSVCNRIIHILFNIFIVFVIDVHLAYIALRFIQSIQRGVFVLLPSCRVYNVHVHVGSL